MSHDDTGLEYAGRRKEIEELVDEENRDDESLERSVLGMHWAEEDPLQKD
jgi:hypothetical protein